MEDYRHILLIKPSSLGDIVHAMPTCAAIRRAYPKARLTWLVKREWAGLVERIDGIVARCGISKNLLYHYYAGKEELFLRVMERAYAAMRPRRSASHARCRPVNSA